jgi:hypothetical protein
VETAKKKVFKRVAKNSSLVETGKETKSTRKKLAKVSISKKKATGRNAGERTD